MKKEKEELGGEALLPLYLITFLPFLKNITIRQKGI